MLKKLLSGLFKAELEALQKEHQSQITELRQQTEEALQAQNTLHSEKQALEQSLKQKEQENQTAQQNLVQLQTQLTDMQNASNQSEAQLAPQLQALEAEKAALEQALAQQKNMSELQGQQGEALTAAQAEISHLKEELNAHQQQKGFMQGQLRKLETEKETEIQRLKAQISELESRLEAALAHVSGPSQDTPSQPERSQKLILIVDDALTTRILQKNMLESAGFQVMMAKDGLEGQALCQEHHPDLVITDVEMPKMDGFELTRWIKQSPFREVPVLMVTSHADPEFQQKGREAGADDFVEKTNFNQKTFVEIVGRHL
ncbi:MAG: response regulator [Candidatus Sericytochromatia bacterium]